MAPTKVVGAWLEPDGTTLEEVNGIIKVKQITSSLLKTNIGSLQGNLESQGTLILSLTDYSFFPSICSDTYQLTLGTYDYPYTNTIARFSLTNDDTSSHPYKVYWRYITSSEPPVIFTIKNRAFWVSEPVRDENGNIICPIKEISKDGKVEHGEGFETPKELLGKPAPEICRILIDKKLDVSSLERLKCKVIIK